MLVGKGMILRTNTALRIVTDKRGNRLFAGTLVECLEYLKHWDECYS